MDVFLAFHQTFQPVVGSILLSALIAGLPLYVLFVMLAVLRLPAWICALASLATAMVLGWLVWGMPGGITIGGSRRSWPKRPPTSSPSTGTSWPRPGRWCCTRTSSPSC